MEAPPYDMLKEIIQHLNDCQKWQSIGMDIVASACWDEALQLINDWTLESCGSFVVTGRQPDGSRRIIFSECGYAEARRFIESLPGYITPQIERIVPATYIKE